jgi:hypothetical protein
VVVGLQAVQILMAVQQVVAQPQLVQPQELLLYHLVIRDTLLL